MSLYITCEKCGVRELPAFDGPHVCRDAAQQQKCLRGEHEAQQSEKGPFVLGTETRFTSAFGVSEKTAFLCQHCRCLYVERA